MKSVALTPENIAEYDMVMVITDHHDVDYDLVGENAKLIIDTRNVYQDRDAFTDKVVKA